MTKSMTHSATHRTTVSTSASLTRRVALGLAAACALAMATPSFAAERQRFDAAAFAAAQAAGKPILVEVHADWCPVCTKQKPIIGGLEKRPDFDRLSIFTVDFDGQKDALRFFKVDKQSTLITFKGKDEQQRSVGVTDPQKIEALMRSAI